MAEKEPPQPKPGTAFALFKPAGAKTFSANIILIGGAHKEVWDTGQTTRASAVGAANHRVIDLNKEHRIESAAEYKKRTGSRLSTSAIRHALYRGEKPDESSARRRKGTAPEQRELMIPDQVLHNGHHQEEQGEDDGDWERDLVRMENKQALGFNRIVAMVLLRQDDDPIYFRECVRAIVTEVTLAGLTPTGRLGKKRGPYKPRPA